jgi:hypothetical protein
VLHHHVHLRRTPGLFWSAFQQHPRHRHLLHRRPLPLRDGRLGALRLLAGLYHWWPKCSAESPTRPGATSA